MTRTVATFVSLVSHAERIWALLDWAEIRRIIRDGLCAFIAGCILVALYTVEGVRSFYQWAQPRLANLLQHPQQTIKNGPALLLTEAWESVAENTATPLQRIIVRGDMFVFHYINLFSRKVSIISHTLTVDNIVAWAKVQRMA